jgi:hypothetical protein
LLYPTEWFPLTNKEQQQMNMEFLEVLESYLSFKHTQFSLEDKWKQTGPQHLRCLTVADIENVRVTDQSAFMSQ